MAADAVAFASTNSIYPSAPFLPSSVPPIAAQRQAEAQMRACVVTGFLAAEQRLEQPLHVVG